MIEAGAYRDLLTDHLEEVLGPVITSAFTGEPVPARDEPETASLPFLDPESWAAHKRHCGCGECPWCRFQMMIRVDHFSAPHKKIHRLASERSYRWPGFAAALECYVDHKAEGYGAISSSGVVYDVGTLGQTIQTTSRSRGSAAMNAAEDVAEMDLALSDAFRGFETRGLSVPQCMSILFARTIGDDVRVRGRDGGAYRKRVPVESEALSEQFGVTCETIREVAKSGKFRLTVELVRRGLMPMPRNASARLQIAVEGA